MIFGRADGPLGRADCCLDFLALSAGSCIMWGLALGACLVWVVTQAHAVSEADSQSRARGLRLLLPSVSVKLPTRQG